jgi:hypothetical protein
MKQTKMWAEKWKAGRAAHKKRKEEEARKVAAAATAKINNPYAKTATEKNKDTAAAAKVDNPYATVNETQE